MGKGRVLEGAYRMDSYYTPIRLTHWELGADHGFTDDGLDSTQVCFLIVVTACLEIHKRHFQLLQYVRRLHICENKNNQSCLKNAGSNFQLGIEISCLCFSGISALLLNILPPYQMAFFFPVQEIAEGLSSMGLNKAEGICSHSDATNNRKSCDSGKPKTMTQNDLIWPWDILLYSIEYEEVVDLADSEE